MLERLNISTPEYFALPYASNSGITQAHELFGASEAGKHDPTKAYRFGGALDAIATDPHELDLDGMTVDEIGLLHPMRRSIEANAIYISLFKDHPSQVVFIDKEFPIVFDNLPTTIPVKCKYDFYNTKFPQHFGSDLKSTMAKDHSGFINSIRFFKYHQQAAWYMDITRTDRFIIIGVSKVNYKTFVVQIRRDDKFYEDGKKMYLHHAKSWWKLYGFSGVAND